MKIRMKSDQKSAAPDGLVVKVFKKGKTYDLPDEDAKRFIDKDWATGSSVAKTAAEPEPEEVEEAPAAPPEEETEEEPERHKK